MAYFAVPCYWAPAVTRKSRRARCNETEMSVIIWCFPWHIHSPPWHDIGLNARNRTFLFLSRSQIDWKLTHNSELVCNSGIVWNLDNYCNSTDSPTSRNVLSRNEKTDSARHLAPRFLSFVPPHSTPSFAHSCCKPLGQQQWGWRWR